MNKQKIAQELIILAKELVSFDRKMLESAWKDARKQFKRKMRMDIPSLVSEPAWKEFQKVVQKVSDKAERLVSEGRMTEEAVYEATVNRALEVMMLHTKALGDSVDPMERERLGKLVMRLRKWTMDTIKPLPNTAPVLVQLLESLTEVESKLRGKGSLRGKEAVEALIKAMGGLYTVGAAPLKGLWRKYGDPVEELLYKYRILP